MKISETTSYPHPVLTNWNDDIVGATFSAEPYLREDVESQSIDIHFTVDLTQPEIIELINNGGAQFGCFITCAATGLRRLQVYDYPSSTHEFTPGALLGRVLLRPMIWTTKKIDNYAPTGLHSEFGSGCEVAVGQLIALDDEYVVHVLNPPIPTFESIFEIKSSKEIKDGSFQIDLASDRIFLMMGEETYSLVQQLRNVERSNSSLIMNALYVPFVMEVLSYLAEGPEQYSGFRWYKPFMHHCDQLDVDPQRKGDLLSNAQKLLNQPFALLKQIITVEETTSE